jgi:hypothetical protein
MRHYLDLVLQGPPPWLARFVHKVLLPEYEVSLVLLALCYGLATVSMGVWRVAKAGTAEEACQALSSHIALTKALLLGLVLTYLWSCLVPFIYGVLYLIGPEIDHGKERLVVGALAIACMALLAAAGRLSQRFLREGTQEAAGPEALHAGQGRGRPGDTARLTTLELLLLTGIVNIGSSLAYPCLENGSKHFSSPEAVCSVVLAGLNAGLAWVGLRRRAYVVLAATVAATGWWIRHAFIHNLGFL